MTDELWIVIPRWNDFQHPDTTRTGHMPWVKNFTRLLSDDNYLDLSFPQRGLLHSLWLEYARSRGSLRVRHGSSMLSLSRRLGHPIRFSQLEALNHAGFIEFSASKPASTTASKPTSSLQVQKRREEKRTEEPSLPTNVVVGPTEGGRAGIENGIEPKQDLAALLIHAAPDDIPF